MRFLFLIILCFPLLTFGQKKPQIFTEDIAPSTVGIRCYCKPGLLNQSRSRGLELSYKLFGPAILKGEGETLSEPFSRIRRHHSITLKLKFPIINNEGFKLLAGYNYQPEWYEYQRVGTDYNAELSYIDGLVLKSSAFSATAIKSFNETIYAVLKLKAATNGDYDMWMDWHPRYRVVNVLGAVGVKNKPGREWGGGIVFSQSFRRTIALPFLFYNRNFNDRWGLETVLPASILVRYNLDEKTILLSGLEYNSRSFAITIPETVVTENPVYHFNHSEVEVTTKVERQIVPWLWFDIQGGLQFNFSSEFSAKNEELVPSFMVDPKDSWFLRVGLFLSPPDDLIK